MDKNRNLKQIFPFLASPEKIKTSEVLTDVREMREPPRSQNIYRNMSEETQWYHKIQTLPRVNEERLRILKQYRKLKSHWLYLGKIINISEFIVATVWSYLMLILFSETFSDYTFTLLSKGRYQSLLYIVEVGL